jgi:hypothetical protein
MIGPDEPSACLPRAGKATSRRLPRLLAVLFLSLGSTAHAASETVTVTELDGSYEVVIITEEQTLIPIHPDKGFFPKQTYDTRFITRGAGSASTLAGRPARRFTVSEDAVTAIDNCIHAKGELVFSEEAGELLLDADLTRSHSRYKNHSATYRQVRFFHPTIRDLKATDSLLQLRDVYVRAQGHFSDDGRHFVIGGSQFRSLDACTPGPAERVEILARVIHPRTREPDPYLYILRKSGSENSRCCPWGN